MVLQFVIQVAEFLISVKADCFDADCLEFNFSIICRLSKSRSVSSKVPKSLGCCNMLNFGDGYCWGEELRWDSLGQLSFTEIQRFCRLKIKVKCQKIKSQQRRPTSLVKGESVCFLGFSIANVCRHRNWVHRPRESLLVHVLVHLLCPMHLNYRAFT